MMLQQVDRPFRGRRPTESVEIKGRNIRNDEPGELDGWQWLECLSLELWHIRLTIIFDSVPSVRIFAGIDGYRHHCGIVIGEQPIEGSKPGLSMV